MIRIAYYFSPLSRLRKPTGVGKIALGLMREFDQSPRVDLTLLSTKNEFREAEDVIRDLDAKRGTLPLSEVWSRRLLTGTSLLSVDRAAGNAEWVFCPKEQPVCTRGMKLAVLVHDLRALEPEIPGIPERPSARDVARWKKTLKMTLARADRIFFVSEFTKARFCELMGADNSDSRFVVAPNPVDDLFLDQESPRPFPGAVETTLSGRPYVLVPGSLTWRKGGDLILDLAQKLAGRGDDLRLVVIGRRHDAELLHRARKLQEEIADCPLILTGYVEDEELHALYRKASAVLFPSRYEGFGIPAAEAMACGKPLVAGDQGALREVTGDCAWITPYSAEGILDRVDQVLKGGPEVEERIARGRDRARAWRWPHVRDRILDSLEAET